jgi:hypothetical protein
LERNGSGSPVGKWWELQYAPNRARGRITLLFLGLGFLAAAERASSSVSELSEEEEGMRVGRRGAVVEAATTASGAMYFAYGSSLAISHLADTNKP